MTDTRESIGILEAEIVRRAEFNQCEDNSAIRRSIHAHGFSGSAILEFIAKDADGDTFKIRKTVGETIDILLVCRREATKKSYQQDERDKLLNSIEANKREVESLRAQLECKTSQMTDSDTDDETGWRPKPALYPDFQQAYANGWPPGYAPCYPPLRFRNPQAKNGISVYKLVNDRPGVKDVAEQFTLANNSYREALTKAWALYHGEG